MPGNAKWVVDQNWARLINQADLNALAAGSTVLSSVADITNGGSNDLFMDISVRLIGITSFTGGTVVLCPAYLLDDGLTYGDGSMTSGSRITRLLQTAPAYSVVAPGVAGTTCNGYIGGIPLDPGSFRFALGNNLPQALSTTSAQCNVFYRTRYLNLNF
jgi:hypothetical protein